MPFSVSLCLCEVVHNSYLKRSIGTKPEDTNINNQVLFGAGCLQETSGGKEAPEIARGKNSSFHKIFQGHRGIMPWQADPVFSELQLMPPGTALLCFLYLLI